jgi:(p)ppGpp synthase/HD superfamily hydrolase
MKMLSSMIMLATEAHDGQFDKGGRPYILHSLTVMHKLRTEDEELMCMAAGHDVIEDGKIKGVRVTYALLAERGMSDRVIEGIRCLTRMPGETEEEYQAKVKSNRDSRRVKKADLQHNSDIRRLKGVTEKDVARIIKYHKFWLELEAIDEAERMALA